MTQADGRKPVVDSRRLALSKHVLSRLVRQQRSERFDLGESKNMAVLKAAIKSDLKFTRNKKATVRMLNRLKRVPGVVGVRAHLRKSDTIVAFLFRSAPQKFTTTSSSGEYDGDHLVYLGAQVIFRKKEEAESTDPLGICIPDHGMRRWYERREGLAADTRSADLLKIFEDDLARAILPRDALEKKDVGHFVSETKVGTWLWVMSAIVVDGQEIPALSLKTFYSPDMELVRVHAEPGIPKKAFQDIVKKSKGPPQV